MKIVEIPISKIKRDPDQPRTNFDPADISDMAQSILTEGVINPVEVDKGLVIITGEMRWRACKEAGLKTVPCKIITISPKLRFRRQVIENVHHNTMTGWDTATALDKLLRQLLEETKLKYVGGKPNKGVSFLAKVIGKGPNWISDHLQLLQTSRRMQTALKGDKIPYTLVRAIQATPDDFKEEMEKKIISGGFTNRDTAIMVGQALALDRSKSQEILNMDFRGISPGDALKEIKKILPKFSTTPMEDSIDAAFKPSEEITKQAIKLKELLDKYPVTEIGGFNIPRVILALNGLERSMKEWLTKAPTKQIT